VKQILRTALVVALLTLVVGAAPTADAADATDGGPRQEVGVSVDGTTYQQSLGLPLFDPSLSWVPGDVRSSRFWVRNQADGPGDLTIDLVPRDRTGLFRSSHLAVAARAGTGPWMAVRAGEPLRLLAEQDVPTLAEVPVMIRVALSPEAPNGTMVLGTDFDLGVTIADARASGADGETDGPGGLLPGTGSTSSRWVLPLGLILLAAGVLLLARRETDRPLTGPPLSGDHA
jgi:LPXTG-motif cell wall-anchored protein